MNKVYVLGAFDTLEFVCFGIFQTREEAERVGDEVESREGMLLEYGDTWPQYYTFITEVVFGVETWLTFD